MRRDVLGATLGRPLLPPRRWAGRAGSRMVPRMRRALTTIPILLASCITAPPPRPQTAACGDVAGFRAEEIARADGATRSALERWHPPAPPSGTDRGVVERIARDYLARCATPEVVELTKQLVAFPTVSAEQRAADGAAFRAMAAFLEGFAKDAGLGFHTFGANDAWEISLGQGAAELGFVMHGDVVPAAAAPSPDAGTVAGAQQPLPPGWTQPPFEARVVGGRLYGRGVEDDKGPIASALVVLRMLSRMGLAPRSRIAVIIGTGEENDWSGMQKYAKEVPPPQNVISVDSSFPLVIAEMGWVGFHLTAQAQPGQAICCAEVVEARAGEFITQVPGEAWATLRPGSADTADQLLGRVLAAAEPERAADGRPRVEARIDKGNVVMRALGVTAHSSSPEDGDNALWRLARVSTKVGVCDGGAGTLLRIIAERMSGDHYGVKLNLAYSDPLGALVAVPTLFRMEGTAARLSINIRRPSGMTNADFQKRLDSTVADLQRAYGQNVAEARADRHVGDPAAADLRGPLSSTLLDVYRAATGDLNAKAIGVRGGTYARLFPGAVSFGPALPGTPYRGHVADEYIEVSTLDLLTRMLYEATLRLDRPVAQAATTR